MGNFFFKLIYCISNFQKYSTLKYANINKIFESRVTLSIIILKYALFIIYLFFHCLTIFQIIFDKKKVLMLLSTLENLYLSFCGLKLKYYG